MKKHTRGSYDQRFLDRTVDELIVEFMNENDVEGLALSIVQAPYIPRVSNYGKIEKSDNNECLVSYNTSFYLGKISQGYMAIAIMQAYESKLLKLHDKITKYVPELKKDFQEVTILNLLQHTSGIEDFRKTKGYDQDKKYGEKQIVEMINKIGFAYDVDTKIYRSASNFYLLSLVIDKVTKMKYEEYVTKNQIELLKLKNTFFAKDLESRIKKAEPNYLDKNYKHQLFKKEVPYIDGNEVALNGKIDFNLRGYKDVFASAYEVSFWDVALAGEILVKKLENRSIIYGATKLNGSSYNASCGWQFTETKGFMDIYDDNAAGFSTYLSRFTAPEDLVCVTILATKPGLYTTDLARKVAACFKTNLRLEVDLEKYILLESHNTAQATYDKLKTLIEGLKIAIFSEIDHQDNAVKAKMKMKFSKVIIFGNPAVGTNLMLENPASFIELPLRIGVFEDNDSHVWIISPRLKNTLDKFSLEKSLGTVIKVEQLIEMLMNEAISVY